MDDSIFVNRPIGLYIHVPFCTTLCSYCDFYRTASESGVPEGFEMLLAREADRYREDPPIELDSIYLGGGTPSLLEEDSLERLFEALREIFHWNAGAEVTLEANPETLSPERVRRWRRAGVTRLSIGVQSLNDAELAALGRRATAGQAEAAVFCAAAEGYERLSADLMLGIPGQTLQSFRGSLQRILSWPLDHLSAYMLDLHRGTALYQAVLRGEAELPGEDATSDMYEFMCGAAETHGFEQYEVSNFARPGGRSRHNLRYWRREDCIGIGPSAHGQLRGLRTENPRSTREWSEKLSKGLAPHERTIRVSARERLENRLIFGIRLSDGVEWGLVETLAGREGRDAERLVAPLLENGYALLEEGRLRLTSRGFLLSNEILTYLLPAAGLSPGTETSTT